MNFKPYLVWNKINYNFHKRLFNRCIVCAIFLIFTFYERADRDLRFCHPDIVSWRIDREPGQHFRRYLNNACMPR